MLTATFRLVTFVQFLVQLCHDIGLLSTAETVTLPDA